MIPWIILIVAGLCEIVWALGLKFSDGLSPSKPTAFFTTIVFMILSIYLLAVAAKSIPIGISYTIWVGIGALGAFIGGIYFFGEKVSVTQIAFFLVILIGIVGLKLSSVKF